METGELPPPPLHFLKVSTFYVCEYKGMVMHTQVPVLTSTCLKLALLFTAVYTQAAGPQASRDTPISAAHIPQELWGYRSGRYNIRLVTEVLGL